MSMRNKEHDYDKVLRYAKIIGSILICAVLLFAGIFFYSRQMHENSNSTTLRVQQQMPSADGALSKQSASYGNEKEPVQGQDFSNSEKQDNEYTEAHGDGTVRYSVETYDFGETTKFPFQFNLH